jgi:hypothetical protein
MFRRGTRTAIATALTVGLASWLVVPAAHAAPNHTTVVGSVPSTLSPDVLDGAVHAIYDAGTKILAGGTFTRVRGRDSVAEVARSYVMAFDKATGAVDPGFQPAVNGEITSIVAGPTAGTAYLAGTFSTVNGITRKKLALVDTVTGAPVASFVPPSFNGQVKDVALVGARLLVGGVFTNAGTANPRGGLASLDGTTGALDSYLTVKLTGHHNWTSANGGSKALVGVQDLAVSPNGTQLVAIGNFKNANGVLHDQVVKLTLGATAATIASWNTVRYAAACSWRSFDASVREVDYAPDGSYFVIVASGGSHPGTLCDVAARWSATATGAGLQPTWISSTGGDTLLSVAVSEQAVYVGGHMRWMNNSAGRGVAAIGAVARPSIAALDPASGIPLAWNPGRNPRGVGVGELYLTPAGLWLGNDMPWIGNSEYRRERIAFFPLAGGAAPHSTAGRALPGNVYLGGGVVGQGVSGIVRRSYDGASAVGPTTPVDNAGGPAWTNARGAFWVGGTLFYASGSSLWRRTFAGTTFGPAVKLDPYHDPRWDGVRTGTGTTQTYVGVTVGFYAGIQTVTGMTYSGGRLYYTLAGQAGLFWRWFSPDSGVLGPDKFAVAGTTAFGNSGGIFVSGGYLYVTNRVNGALSRMAWNNGVPTGKATVVSTPATGGPDWRARAVFVAP